MIRRAALIALTLVVTAAAAQGVSTARGGRGAVAAAHPEAADAGIAMLEAGGNAVDAAAAVAFTLAVVEPFGSGLGGGGVALVRLASAESSIAYNFRDAAPNLATYANVDYSRLSEWQQTAFSACTPGLVAGVLAMHGAHGRLPRAQVMAPAIAAAREGYVAGPTLCQVINDSHELLLRDDDAAAIFLVDSLPPEIGATLTNPDLARVLQAISDGGAPAFYTGTVAAALAGGLAAKGGLIRAEDLAAYEVITGEPVVDTYRGHTLESAPPPLCGVAVLETLSILEQFDVPSFTYPSVESISLYAEAMWNASRDYRREVGDPRYVAVDTGELLADEHARAAADGIQARFADPPAPAGVAVDDDPAGGSTSHFSIVDAEGNAVSQTQTLGGYFGGVVVAAGTGVIFNDQLKNFSTRAGLPNSLSPGRRPRSTQSPTIVLRDGELAGVIGSPGNFRIVTTVPLVLSLMLDLGMPPEEAIAAPRIAIRHFSSITGGHGPLELEGGIPAEMAETLGQRGYTVQTFEPLDLHFGGVHLVWIDPATGERVAVADPRRDGAARAQ